MSECVVDVLIDTHAHTTACEQFCVSSQENVMLDEGGARVELIVACAELLAAIAQSGDDDDCLLALN